MFLTSTFRRPPDRAAFVSDERLESLTPASDRIFTNEDVRMELSDASAGVAILITSVRTPLRRVQLRWNMAVPVEARILGDTLERAYGELAWRGHEPERALSWYFLLQDADQRTHGVGVLVQPAAFCFWTVDPAGVSLWLDLACGGVGVELGGRTMTAATVVTREGVAGESPFGVAQAFCRQMCPTPRLPREAVIGSNDWYYAWGNNTPDQLLADADLLREIAPHPGPTPFVVVDDGWQESTGCGGGPWKSGNARFPDMPGLAADLRSRGTSPGIWMRPLGRNPALPASLRIAFREHPDPSIAHSLDPSHPEVLAAVAEGVSTVVGWGFEFIKHDFTAFDLIGRWGSAAGYQVTGNGSMAHVLTQPGWGFSDRSRTTAEIALDLYRTIRQAAGDQTLIMGCNTFSHLSAGLFELMRTGDDNSSLQWERTRRMGVNALAFRMPQHGTFYAADADIAPLGPDVPWAFNSQWLDLLGRSGTPLFFSCPRQHVTGEIKAALRAALSLAASASAPAEPLDWMHTTSPQTWREASGGVVHYDWFSPNGVLGG